MHSLQEIIEEITVYRIRLRRLIKENEDLANKDSLSPEDRDKLAKDTKDLEKRFDSLDDDAKKEESRYVHTDLCNTSVHLSNTDIALIQT